MPVCDRTYSPIFHIAGTSALSRRLHPIGEDNSAAQYSMLSEASDQVVRREVDSPDGTDTETMR